MVGILGMLPGYRAVPWGAPASQASGTIVIGWLRWRWNTKRCFKRGVACAGITRAVDRLIGKE